MKSDNYNAKQLEVIINISYTCDKYLVKKYQTKYIFAEVSYSFSGTDGIEMPSIEEMDRSELVSMDLAFAVDTKPSRLTDKVTRIIVELRDRNRRYTHYLRV